MFLGMEGGQRLEIFLNDSEEFQQTCLDLLLNSHFQLLQMCNGRFILDCLAV